MTKLLYLTLDKASGFTLLDSSVGISNVILKSFLIKFKNGNFFLLKRLIYLRISGLSNCVISNTGNVYGLPLLYTENIEGSLWVTDIQLKLSSKLTTRVDFELVDQEGQLIPFGDISSVEIVLQVE